MTTALTRLSGSAFELTLTVPWAEIKSVYDKVFEELAAEIEVEGFRKGKAPKEMLASKINKTTIFDEVVKRILPNAYAKALEEHHLKPIVNPKIEIASGEEEKDWQFVAKAAEKPVVDLDDYKKHIAEINAKDKIWTPDKGTQPAPDNQQPDAGGDEEKKKKINTIVDKLLAVCSVEVPALLVDSEVDRLISRLIDDVRAAGITYEQYLASKSTTAQAVRDNYQKQVEATVKLELILEAVADDLGVTVDEKEVDDIINKETDPAKKDQIRAQSYYLTSILRREKTLTKLTVL